MDGHATRQVRRKTIGGVAVLGLAASLLMVGTSTASAVDPVDLATLVEVDRPGTTMISAAPFDVGEYGYVEREFFASGDAHQYLRNGVATPMVGDYHTRVVVRQPSPEKFNGTLIVEWFNQTTGNDGEFTFSEAHNTLLNEGFAYASLSPQRTGVRNIVATQPERYAGLEVDSESCAPFVCPTDAMQYEIVSQVSKALKESPDSPLAALGVSKLILTGQSGAGVSITRYHNDWQPLTGLFDGFVNWDGWGLNERTDLTTPFIKVSSWTVTDVSAQRPLIEGAYVREWQVNGSAHGSKFAHEYFDAVFVRDGTQPNGRSFTEWHTASGSCTNPQPGTPVRVGQVIGAAFVAVDQWVRGGPAAAPSTYFQRNADGTLARNEHGLAIGGVQIADAAVPSVRTLRQAGPGIFCRYAGAWADYTAEELAQMYPSHGAYVSKVTNVTEAALEAGYLLASDAEATIQEAAQSDIGKKAKK
jgi:Alpha/beta hydrolase domain